MEGLCDNMDPDWGLNDKMDPDGGVVTPGDEKLAVSDLKIATPLLGRNGSKDGNSWVIPICNWYSSSSSQGQVQGGKEPGCLPYLPPTLFENKDKSKFEDSKFNTSVTHSSILIYISLG